MADNILKAVIDVSAPNAVQTFNQVAVATTKTQVALQKLPQVANQSTLALGNLGRVVQDAPFGFIGIANNINPLLESFQRLKATTGTTGGALKALGNSLLGAGGLGFAVSVASSLLVVFGDQIFGASKKTKEAKDEAEKYKDAIKGIFSETAKEAAQVSVLIGVLKSETETRERRLSAIKELQKIQPDIFKGLKLEGDAVIGLDAAYQAYIKNLSTVIAVKIKQQQLEGLITKQLELQGATLTKSQADFINLLKEQNQLQLKNAKESGERQKALLNNFFVTKAENKALDEQKRIEGDIAQLIKDISELSSGVKLPGTKDDDKKKIKETKKELEDLLSVVKLNIVDPNDATFVADLKTAATKIQDQLKKAVSNKPAILPIPIDPQLIIDAQRLQKAAEIIEKGVKDALAGAFSGFGEGIGELLAGGDVEDAFKSFAQTIGNVIKGIGSQLIELGVAALAVKVALGSLFKNPALLIAAGVVLQALGSAFSSAIGKGFAGGGYTGDGGKNDPAGIVHKGEFVIPASAVGRLGVGFLNSLAFGGGIRGYQNGGLVGGVSSGGVVVMVQGQFGLRGQDLVASISATQKSQSRNF